MLCLNFYVPQRKKQIFATVSQVCLLPLPGLRKRWFWWIWLLTAESLQHHMYGSLDRLDSIALLRERLTVIWQVQPWINGYFVTMVEKMFISNKRQVWRKDYRVIWHINPPFTMVSILKKVYLTLLWNHGFICQITRYSGWPRCTLICFNKGRIFQCVGYQL